MTGARASNASEEEDGAGEGGEPKEAPLSVAERPPNTKKRGD